MKIAFFEVKGWEKSYFLKNLNKEKTIFFKEPLKEEHTPKIKNCDALVVFIASNITKKIIDSMPNLKLICTMSTGFDHIDIKHAKKKKITVCSVPSYGENTVAEHAFALMLSLSRNIHKAYMRTIQNNFSIDGLMGFDLKGKTLGIIGGGHIGLHLARMGKAFSMNILVYDLYRDSFKSEILGFNYATLDEIYTKSDVISLHLPYNKQTHHLINKSAFEKMKKGVIIVNTARGGIIDTDALLWALEKNIVGGAGLDVLENEHDVSEEKELLHSSNRDERYQKLVQNHILLNKENIVYTPHIAFYSKEAITRILETTIININNFNKEKPTNVIN